MWLDRQETYLAWAGLASALIIALAFLAISTWIILSGNPVPGTILGTVDIVGLVTVFISGKRQLRSKASDAEIIDDE